MSIVIIFLQSSDGDLDVTEKILIGSKPYISWKTFFPGKSIVFPEKQLFSWKNHHFLERTITFCWKVKFIRKIIVFPEIPLFSRKSTKKIRKFSWDRCPKSLS